jgi:proteasome lid subunit RPN8/RPN11
VKITRRTLTDINAHATEGYPLEICGMLVARRGSRKVTEIRRAHNAIVDRARDTYQISIQEHKEIDKACEAAGLDIVGYYHSHPDHASYASIRDTEQAWPAAYYLIVSCMNGEVRESKVFSKPDWDSKEMIEEPLEVVSR